MEIAEMITIYLSSMLKIILGIVTGYVAGFPAWLTMLLTGGGMMTAVVIFSYFGNWIKERWLRKLVRKRFSPKSRRRVRVWRKWGMKGVAFFTPIAFMPIPGTLIAISFGSPVKRILSHMFVSITLWTIVLTWLFYRFADFLLPYFG